MFHLITFFFFFDWKWIIFKNKKNVRVILFYYHSFTFIFFKSFIRSYWLKNLSQWSFSLSLSLDLMTELQMGFNTEKEIYSSSVIIAFLKGILPSLFNRHWYHLKIFIHLKDSIKHFIYREKIFFQMNSSL
jgi:hypothetical protein